MGPLGVKNCAECSGWQVLICFIRFDFGALLCDLSIFSDWHNWHLKCNENVLFCVLMAANRWKKYEKWPNCSLNLASCSTSAIIKNEASINQSWKVHLGPNHVYLYKNWKFQFIFSVLFSAKRLSVWKSIIAHDPALVYSLQFSYT